MRHQHTAPSPAAQALALHNLAEHQTNHRLPAWTAIRCTRDHIVVWVSDNDHTTWAETLTNPRAQDDGIATITTGLLPGLCTRIRIVSVTTSHQYPRRTHLGDAPVTQLRPVTA